MLTRLLIALCCALIVLVVVALANLEETRETTIGVLLAITGPALAISFVFLYRSASRIASGLHPIDLVEPEPDESDSLWTDDSVDLRTDDRFDRSGFARSVTEALVRLGRGKSSSVTALVGSWGLGKTSILSDIERRLSAPQPNSGWLVAHLNPWKHSSSESLVAGFFEALRGALPADHRWSEAKESLGNLLEAAAGFGSATSLFGFDSSNLLNASARQLKGGASLSRAEARADAALRNLHQPILIVIDDVDRLGPAELVHLFQLVRALGRLPYVHYLLAYDEASVVDALYRSELAGTVESARDYLQKIVQLRFDVPPLRQGQAAKFMQENLNSLLNEQRVEVADTDERRFEKQFNDFVVMRLKTPRSLYRWVLHLDVLYPQLKAEVDFYDFVLIVWLRLTYPAVATMLQENEHEIFTQQVPPRTDLDTRHQLWLDKLARAGVQQFERNDMYAFLAKILPTIDDAKNKKSTPSNRESTRRRHGVGHEDYFGRYFSHHVPSDELPESHFTTLMTKLVAGANSVDQAQLGEFVLSDRASILSRIEDHVTENRSATLPVLKYLLQAGTDASDVGLLSPQSRILYLSARLLRDSPEPLKILQSLFAEARLVGPALDVVSVLIGQKDRDPRVVEPLRRVALQTLIGEVNGASSDAVPNLPWKLLWNWAALDSDGLRKWYRGHVEEGIWPLVDAVAGFVGMRRISGVEAAPWKLSGIEEDTVETYLGMDWLKARLSNGIDDLNGEELFLPDSGMGPEDTFENRQKISRAWLKQFELRHGD